VEYIGSDRNSYITLPAKLVEIDPPLAAHYDVLGFAMHEKCREDGARPRDTPQHPCEKNGLSIVSERGFSVDHA
jgi:hypothetical protein